MTIAFCLHIVKQYFAECAVCMYGIRTTYNLRTIPHQNFRKIYVIEIPHSAKYTNPLKNPTTALSPSGLVGSPPPPTL